MWNSRTRRLVENRNVVFIKTLPHLIPQPSQLSPLQGLQSPSLDFTEDTLDDNYVLSEEMLRDVRDYTAALDFSIDILVGRGGVTPAVTRSQANQTPAVIGNQGNSSNTSAVIAELFRTDILTHLHELKLFSTEGHDILYPMGYRDMLSAIYTTYATTNLQESCLRGGEKERIPNTFKEVMSLAKVAHWKEAAHKEILSLEKQIALRYCFVQALVEEGKVTIHYMNT